MTFLKKSHPRKSLLVNYGFLCLCLYLHSCIFNIIHASAFSIGSTISLRQRPIASNINTILQMSDEPPLTAFLDKVSRTGLDNSKIQRNSLVVAKYDLPQLGIFADQTYELQSIYMQGLRQGQGTTSDDGESENRGNSNGLIEKIDLPELDLSHPNGFANIPPGYDLFITLYSEMYHGNDAFGRKAVVTTPQEVGLVSMKDEVFDSVLVALPILSFWLGTCFTFSNWYHTKYGGGFLDAFFRT
mmetsp:Transcript_2378/g.3664  ORF Transcript_2378/g.3664 Transcript_2378/m.3664 type:complete len:243 (-) Transcript_2378:43-771(-)